MVQAEAPLTQALLAMTAGGMGMTAICDTTLRPIGIFTDGDLRRALEKGCDVRNTKLTEVMTRNPRSIAPEALAVEAATLMESLRISQLLVLDADGSLLGALTTHDLMLAKVI